MKTIKERCLGALVEDGPGDVRLTEEAFARPTAKRACTWPPTVSKQSCSCGARVSMPARRVRT